MGVVTVADVLRQGDGLLDDDTDRIALLRRNGMGQDELVDYIESLVEPGIQEPLTAIRKLVPEWVLRYALPAIFPVAGVPAAIGATASFLGKSEKQTTRDARDRKAAQDLLPRLK